ncbi:hypothetical protein KSF73_07550 [Burkholderiaceae bacterium DAT-1]|nr:hypothetical protein [Burkholderiaceae bacterium DAT-1]
MLLFAFNGFVYAEVNKCPANVNEVPDLQWYESSNGVGSFFRPREWFVKEEVKGNTSAIFITKENIDISGRFLTGMSINKVFDFYRKNNKKPSEFAKLILGKMSNSGVILKNGVISGNSLDMNVLRIRKDEGGEGVIIHYLSIGDDSKDLFYLISFESPAEVWEDNFKFGSFMLNCFAL